MTLRTAHIVLISAAIVLGALLLLYGLSRYASAGDRAALAVGAGGGAAALALAAYLRHFLGKRPT